MQDLVFDFGAHRGEDSAFYLKKGMRVVAVEANPELAAHLRNRFAREIADQRFELIEAAISDKPGTVRFFRNLGSSVWGTTELAWCDRNARAYRATSESIEVLAVTADSVFARYSVPHYVKIDIEGVDRVVLAALVRLDQRPRFVSIEVEKVRFRDYLADMKIIRRMGYNRFQLVPQDRIPRFEIATSTIDGKPLQYRFEEHASGPFGDDLRGRWLPAWLVTLRYLGVLIGYRLFGDDGIVHKVRGGTRMSSVIRRLTRPTYPGWHDLHAKR